MILQRGLWARRGLYEITAGLLETQRALVNAGECRAHESWNLYRLILGTADNDGSRGAASYCYCEKMLGDKLGSRSHAKSCRFPWFIVQKTRRLTLLVLD